MKSMSDAGPRRSIPIKPGSALNFHPALGAGIAAAITAPLSVRGSSNLRHHLRNIRYCGPLSTVRHPMPIGSEGRMSRNGKTLTDDQLKQLSAKFVAGPIRPATAERIKKASLQRLDRLRAIIGSTRNDKMWQQLRGRESEIIAVWEAKEYARAMHGKIVSDTQVAECFQALWGGNFSRHQARSYRLLFERINNRVGAVTFALDSGK